MAKIPKSKTTNKVLFETIRDLRKFANKTNKEVYRAVAAKLASSASHRAQVNVSKIERYAKSGEFVIIPGKVLGTGIISKKINVVAFSASASAIEKIKKAGGTFIEIRDYINKNPKDKLKILI